MKQNKNVISNLIWRFAERCGAQLVTFIVSVVLARILAPEDYGQIALITVFTTIMQVFVDSGLGTALIQKKDVLSNPHSKLECNQSNGAQRFVFETRNCEEECWYDVAAFYYAVWRYGNGL